MSTALKQENFEELKSPLPSAPIAAPTGKRLVAFIIDALVITFISQSLVQYMVKPFIHPFMSSVFLRHIVDFMFSSALGAFYWVGLILLMEATPGKKMMGLRIIHLKENGSLSFSQMMLREFVGRPLSSLPLFLGYLWVFFDTNKRQTWHDLLADTQVVQDS